MVKGDDALAKKRNKARRKKTNRKEGSSSAAVSASVASIIASKKRRASGVRRKCQGMCFSLPTPEDPYNDTLGKAGVKNNDSKKAASLVGRPHRQEDSGLNHKKKDAEAVVKARDERKQALGKAGNLNCPSKFLTLCLNAIDNSLSDQGVCGNNGEERPLFVDAWGVEFLKSYFSGEDVLETSGVPSTTEQIAWIVSVAADTMSRKEKEGLFVASPFLLFLVPSQEKATKVRMVCKPLKALGIHSVSLHSGASVDHQILGLKSCEPEFLISTPGRLIELISRQAVDVSGVSFLVIDGVESLHKDGYMDSLKSIIQSISKKPFSVVFNDFLSSECPSALQNLLLGSVCRLSIDHSIRSQGAYIVQSVDVCSSEQEKLSKGIQALRYACDNRHPSRPLKVLFVVGRDSKSHNVVKILKANGYSISSAATGDFIDVANSENPRSKVRPVISMMNEDNISSADLGAYEIIVLPNFVTSMDDYVKVLTRMARHSLSGVLHSVITEEHAPLAGSLIQILQQCGQAVPDSLQKLAS